jgi:hypothetical protein
MLNNCQDLQVEIVQTSHCGTPVLCEQKRGFFAFNENLWRNPSSLPLYIYIYLTARVEQKGAAAWLFDGDSAIKHV